MTFDVLRKWNWRKGFLRLRIVFYIRMIHFQKICWRSDHWLKPSTLDGAVMVLAAEFSPCGNHVSYKIKNEIVYVLLYIYFVHLLRIKYNNFGNKKMFYHTFSKMGGQSIGCIHPASHAAHVDNPHRIGYRLSLPHEALNRPPVSETSSFWSWIGC